jgi:hypothetical protein
MRVALYKYIEGNKNKIYEGIELGNLLPNEYITDAGYDFQKFYDEYLLEMHNEAEKIIIYLSPIIFKVNLELYSLSDGKNQNILNFNCYDEKAAKISLFYTQSHYDKIYTNELLQILLNISFNINEHDGNERIIELEPINCSACKKSSIIITFSHMKDYIICKNCLVTYLLDDINTRYKLYVDQNYNNIECNKYIIKTIVDLYK